MKLCSPAKINFFLRILNKRPDGYHNIASLMQTVDLCDYLTIAKSDHDAITCSDDSIPTDERNLVWKARELFRKKTGIHFPVSVHIEKHIPHGAGLGGGSGNAATTLYGLNILSERPLELSQLQKWSSEIGTDIPFFFSSGSALCTGRGEIVKDIENTKLPDSFWIFKPPFSISTPQVYEHLNLDTCDRRKPGEIMHDVMKGEFKVCNDLENPAFLVNPKLRELKQQLIEKGYEGVLMTGSGSALFCFEGPPEAEDVKSYQVRRMLRRKDHWYEKEKLNG